MAGWGGGHEIHISDFSLQLYSSAGVCEGVAESVFDKPAPSSGSTVETGVQVGAAVGAAAVAAAVYLWRKRRGTGEHAPAVEGARLSITSEDGGPAAEVELKEGEAVTLGREAEALLRLEHQACSRQHASFLLRAASDGEGLTVTDLNTTNGTFVNAQRIAARQAVELRNGDNVTFGDHARRVVVAGLRHAQGAGDPPRAPGIELEVDAETLQEIRRLSREKRESGEVLHLRAAGGKDCKDGARRSGEWLVSSNASTAEGSEAAVLSVELAFSGGTGEPTPLHPSVPTAIAHLPSESPEGSRSVLA